jgi:hypothetical protein
VITTPNKLRFLPARRAEHLSAKVQRCWPLQVQIQNEDSEIL